MTNEEKKAAYADQLKAQLDLHRAKIDELEAKAAKAGADARVAYHERVEELRGKERAASERLEELKGSSAEAFERLKDGAERAWRELGDAVEDARSKLG